MKPWILPFFSLALAVSAAGQNERNTYTLKFGEDIPYGVSAWSQSELVRRSEGAERRFLPYQKEAVGGLTNDALVDRGAEVDQTADPRATSFYQAFDAKGWYIYIEAKEPGVKELLNKLGDPRSAGNKESYELFFMPGLVDAPYYQIYITPYQNKATFYDWAMPGPDYRSLKDDVRVESLPLKDGVGTFVFIPWQALYDRVPFTGGEWRFTLIRWMPFAKAGGVTWGGSVHETGRFGNLQFEPPTNEQRSAMERHLLQYGWNKFQASSTRLSEYWSDPHIGDPEFYEKVLQPEIERLNALGREWGEAENLEVSKADEGIQNLKDFMEFEYRTDVLRSEYLRRKLFSKQS